MRALIPLLLVAAAAAAVGPDDLALVVNGDSWASRAVANRYRELRGIPDENVVVLHGVGELERIEVAAFRERILEPVLAAIDDRGLTSRIDALAFSTDLPTTVDCSGDLGDAKPPRAVGRIAASTGLTLLAPLVLRGGPGYLPLVRHAYFAPDGRPGDHLPAELQPRYAEAMERLRAGEHAAAAAALTALDAAVAHPELAYNLACARALAGDPEAALASLARSAGLGFWNALHAEVDDDLATLRDDPRFAASLDAMRAHRFAPVATRGFRRTQRHRVDGGTEDGTDPRAAGLLACHLAVTTGRGLGVAEALAMLERSAAADATRPAGTVYLMQSGDVRSTTRQWAFVSLVEQLAALDQPAVILAGRLPDGRPDVVGAVVGSASFDLDGAGLAIRPGALCEHLTSFGGVLRHGAGQTPLTAWLRHGAAGATGTVVEPFAIQAKFPTPFVQLHYRRGATLIEAVWQSVEAPYQLLLVGDPLCAPWATPPAFTLEGIEPGAEIRGPRPITIRSDEPLARVRIALDGRPVHDGSATSWTLDPTGLVPGRHRLRVAVTRDDDIGTGAWRELELRIPGPEPRLDVDPELRWGEDCRLRRPPDQDGRLGLLLPGGEVLVLEPGAHERLVPGTTFGLGATSVRVVALDAAGAVVARGERRTITVLPPEPLPALVLAGEPLPGARLDDGTLLDTATTGDWLAAAGLAEGGRAVGLVEARSDGLHQLRATPQRVARLAIDGRELALDAAGGAPLWLRAGWHRLELEAAPGAGPCELRFGARGEAPLAPETWRHPAPDDPNP